MEREGLLSSSNLNRLKDMMEIVRPAIKDLFIADEDLKGKQSPNLKVNQNVTVVNHAQWINIVIYQINET